MTIAVVGVGIAGLHLALLLQRAGVDPVLHGDRTPDDLRSGRMLNTVARFGRIRRLEQELDLGHLPARTSGVRFTLRHNPAVGNPELSFRGEIDEPWSFVDMRIVQADALEAYLERGGRYELGVLDDDALVALGERFDLVVVAAGRRGLDTLFGVDHERSPFSAPQRELCAMFVEGLGTLEGADFGYHVIPAVGELFQPAFTSFDGEIAGLLFEGVPGGPYAQLAAMDYATDPAAYDARVFELLSELTPDVAALADPTTFGVRGPLDVLRGAITPRVRHATTRLPSGTYALAVGDAWVTNDPVTGQGANTASHCAAVAAQAILGGGPYDEAFCRRVEEAMWAFAGPVTAWTNATLGPPADHVVGAFVAAAGDARVADALIANFNDPPTMWSVLSSHDATASFLASVTGSAARV